MVVVVVVVVVVAEALGCNPQDLVSDRRCYKHWVFSYKLGHST